MNPSLRPNKSTIVRTKMSSSMGLRAVRAGLRVLSPRAPTLAARWAEQLFLTARRHERPSWEAAALASARAGRIRHEGGFVPTWTWTPPGARGSLEAPPTAILVHGWEGRGSQLAAFVPALVAQGLRVATFDAPGHGDSPLRRASLVEHARALVSVGRAFGPARAVVGHSVGGAAILLATRLGLQAERVALVAPPTTPAAFAATFARTLGLDESLEAAMIARVEARYGLRFEDLDVRADAARLRAPLLVVHDRDDPVVAFEGGRLIARAAPRGELVAVTGLGHRAILRAPNVIAAVTEFAGAPAPAPTFAETIDGELYLRDTRW
ncbi:MAG: alpha/beta fold hydrolase [Labilithrix sp.]|nr:alpha/beta fold hydrolase [Labilithrix sp.]